MQAPKRIALQTNYNGKLACRSFIHVDVAPRQPIPERKLQDLVVEIYTKDESHPPVQCRLTDTLRLPLGRLFKLATLPSHGMDHTQFIEWVTAQNPAINVGTEFCVYFYEKVEEEKTLQKEGS